MFSKVKKSRQADSFGVCYGPDRTFLTLVQLNSFNDLSDLIVLEQFKNSMSESIAAYIAEQKVKKTALENRLLHAESKIQAACSAGERRLCSSTNANCVCGSWQE